MSMNALLGRDTSAISGLKYGYKAFHLLKRVYLRLNPNLVVWAQCVGNDREL